MATASSGTSGRQSGRILRAKFPNSPLDDGTVTCIYCDAVLSEALLKSTSMMRQHLQSKSCKIPAVDLEELVAARGEYQVKKKKRKSDDDDAAGQADIGGGSGGPAPPARGAGGPVAGGAGSGMASPLGHLSSSAFGAPSGSVLTTSLGAPGGRGLIDKHVTKVVWGTAQDKDANSRFADWVYGSALPFNPFDHPLFRQWLAIVNPYYNPASAADLSGHLLSEAEKSKQCHCVISRLDCRLDCCVTAPCCVVCLYSCLVCRLSICRNGGRDWI